MTHPTEQPIYTSDWAARQIEAYGALRRKEIAVKAVCWLIVAPALPMFFTYMIAEWIVECDVPRWCYRLNDYVEAFAERYDVRFNVIVESIAPTHGRFTAPGHIGSGIDMEALASIAWTNEPQTRDARQTACSDWVRKTFGDESADSVTIRAKRFIEEALELAQACGLTAGEVTMQMARVYSRPFGECAQEIGGVGVTLLSLCEAAGVSADAEEVREAERCASKSREHWQARDAAKRAAGL